MFPVVSRIGLVVKNGSDKKLLGIEPGEQELIPYYKIDEDELHLAKIQGLEFVGLHIKGRNYGLVRLDEEVESPVIEEVESPVVPEVEEPPTPAIEEVEPPVVPEHEEVEQPVIEEDSSVDELVDELCRENKKDELVEMAEELGLDSSGNKADIAERIVNATL